MVSLYKPSNGLLQGWAVVSDNSGIHVVPIDDLETHRPTACSCEPVFVDGVYHSLP